MRIAPESLDESARLLQDLSSQKKTVAIVGGETERELGNVGKPIDTEISTSRLNRIVEYAPSDQIVTAESGVTLSALQETLRVNGQRLALDPPLPHRATLGGIVASNSYGPRRSRYGSIKDLIIGMTIIRADGTIARGGGRVVKNVAGFDIPKLMVGSMGTLAMIATITLRLHPSPEAQATMTFENCSAMDVSAVLSDMVSAQLEPAATIAFFSENLYALSIVFEGFAAGVEAQMEALRKIGAVRNLTARDFAAGADDLNEMHDAARTQGSFRVKMTWSPSQLPQIHESAVMPLLRSLTDARCMIYPAAGVAFVSGESIESERTLQVLTKTRAFVESQDGTLVLAAAPAELRERVDAWGTPPPSFELMRALKMRFDPQNGLNPGRFVGGI